MDNCKTDAKQIGYKLEWAGDEMIKECKEMLFEKDDDYPLVWPSDMKAEVVKEAVKEHKDIVKEVANEKKETYELIKTEIKNRIINIPPGDVRYTKSWLDAYSKCQEDILDLLERLEVFDIEGYKAKV